MNTPSHWRRIRELFFKALTAPPATRSAFLETACAGDPALAREVGLLLEADRNDEFLEPPNRAAFDSREAEQTLEGRQIGPYQIAGKLGAGGMGDVYEGRRVEGGFSQRVAIKILKRGLDTDQILKQFRIEQQTLAMLAHPCIAKLFDGGVTRDGRPFFVMELVEGRTICDFCNDHALSIRRRIALFLAVCDAVSFAHRHLVVHRDLKPSNILITADGNCKLLDFGLAKLLDPSDPAHTTRSLERRLTPEYASPEQISGGRITTASDVYSLGILLYELLTGLRPRAFDALTPMDWERSIRSSECPPPSVKLTRRATTELNPESRNVECASNMSIRCSDGPPERIARLIRGDLDTIVEAALRGEVERRYQTVDAMSEDIRRYLSGMPVSARKDSLSYRTRKFLGRHRAAAAVSTFIIVLIFAGGAGIVHYARTADRQRSVAESQRRKAQAFAESALNERDEAVQARDESRAVVEFLQGILSACDTRSMGRSVDIKTVLDEAATKYESAFDARPRVRAAIRRTLGRTYSSLGLYHKAESQLNAALEEQIKLLGERHGDVAATQLDLSALHYVQGRFDQAEALTRAALATCTALQGQNSAETADALNALAIVLRAAGQFEEAERAIREALATHETLAGHETTQVALCLNNLANIQSAKGELNAAVDSHAEALRIRKAILPPNHALIGQSLMGLARAECLLGHVSLAVPRIREAMELEAKSLGDDHPEHAGTLRTLAWALRSQDDFTAALVPLRKAQAIYEKRLRPDHPQRIAFKAELGHCLFRLGHYEEARSLLEDFVNNHSHELTDPKTLETVRNDLAEIDRQSAQQVGDLNPE